jgi:DNA replication protein DnaC
MNMIELDRALRTLRLSGMADSLDARLVQAQSDKTAHADFLSTLVRDELTRRQDRLLARRIKDAAFRDRDKTLDNFDFELTRRWTVG